MLTQSEERERQRVKAVAWYAKPENRVKRLAYMKKHREDNIDRYRARHRFWRSGWTQEAFDAAWSAQEGRCAICGVAMQPLGRTADSVAADHDNATNQPRGLLCRICNTRLAHLEDRPWRAAADAYLAKHSANPTQVEVL